MTLITPEQGVNFFIAYLAKYASELSIAVPLERSSYELADSGDISHSYPSLRMKMLLDQQFTLTAETYFSGPFVPEGLDRLAQDFTGRLSAFEKDREEVIEEAVELSSHAQAAFKKLPAKLPMKFISVTINLDEARGEPCCMLNFEMLGDDTKPTLQSIHIVSRHDIDAEISVHRDDQTALASRSREIAREKASGAIDTVLATHLERLTAYPLKVVEPALNPARSAFIETDEGKIDLFWKHGVLTAGIQLTENIRYHGGWMAVRKCPEELVGDLTGRQVSELIVHPDLPEDLVFASGTALPGMKCDFAVVLQYSLFDNESGVIW